MFEQNTILGKKSGNVTCRPVKAEFRLFVVRLRGVGLYGDTNNICKFPVVKTMPNSQPTEDLFVSM